MYVFNAQLSYAANAKQYVWASYSMEEDLWMLYVNAFPEELCCMRESTYVINGFNFLVITWNLPIEVGGWYHLTWALHVGNNSVIG